LNEREPQKTESEGDETRKTSLISSEEDKTVDQDGEAVKVSDVFLKMDMK
jgi:hypothetical protein